MLSCRMENARSFFMLVMVSLTCQLLLRLTFCSPKRAKVFASKCNAFAAITNCVADLVTYCERRKMPYTTFKDWSTILETTQKILSGEVKASEVKTGTVAEKA